MFYDLIQPGLGPFGCFTTGLCNFRLLGLDGTLKTCYITKNALLWSYPGSRSLITEVIVELGNSR